MIEITVCYNVTTSKLAALSSSSSSHNTLIWQFLLCVKLMAEIFSRVCPLSHEKRRLYVVLTLHRTQSVDAQCKILLILISISIVAATVCCSECCSRPILVGILTSFLMTQQSLKLPARRSPATGDSTRLVTRLVIMLVNTCITDTTRVARRNGFYLTDSTLMELKRF